MTEALSGCFCDCTNEEIPWVEKANARFFPNLLKLLNDHNLFISFIRSLLLDRLSQSALSHKMMYFNYEIRASFVAVKLAMRLY